MMTQLITQQSYDSLETLRNQFVIPYKERSYAQQFANVYFLRLTRLRERLAETCRKRWPAHPPCRVLDIDPSKLSLVIGTLYCEMKLKPNVLEDLAREVRVTGCHSYLIPTVLTRMYYVCSITWVLPLAHGNGCRRMRTRSCSKTNQGGSS